MQYDLHCILEIITGYEARKSLLLRNHDDTLHDYAIEAIPTTHDTTMPPKYNQTADSYLLDQNDDILEKTEVLIAMENNLYL
jgi:hypothetical protein